MDLPTPGQTRSSSTVETPDFTASNMFCATESPRPDMAMNGRRILPFSGTNDDTEIKADSYYTEKLAAADHRAQNIVSAAEDQAAQVKAQSDHDKAESERTLDLLKIETNNFRSEILTSYAKHVELIKNIPALAAEQIREIEEKVYVAPAAPAQTAEPVEEIVEEPVEEPVEAPAEEPAEEIAEEPAPAEEPTAEEEPAAEEPAAVEEQPEEPIEEPTEEPAAEPIDEAEAEPAAQEDDDFTGALLDGGAADDAADDYTEFDDVAEPDEDDDLGHGFSIAEEFDADASEEDFATYAMPEVEDFDLGDGSKNVSRNGTVYEVVDDIEEEDEEDDQESFFRSFFKKK